MQWGGDCFAGIAFHGGFIDFQIGKGREESPGEQEQTCRVTIMRRL